MKFCVTAMDDIQKLTGSPSISKRVEVSGARECRRFLRILNIFGYSFR